MEWVGRRPRTLGKRPHGVIALGPMLPRPTTGFDPEEAMGIAESTLGVTVRMRA